MTPNTSEVKIMNENDSLTPIQKFYTSTNIFITGATGFMGKCLLEKLLRACPDIEKIYVLVREKKGKNASDRVQAIFEDVLFSKVKEKNDKLLTKVIAIPGDISSPGLGMTSNDRYILQKEVNIVFHVAATINFNEKLKKAVAINVSGTHEILQLSKEMSNLKAIVHVSTAYSNCHLNKIDEKFYKYPISYKELSAVLEKLDERAIDELTPRILGQWPNTYVFTKAMAENLVQKEKEDLPLAVFRPAVVTSTWKEPLQGWIDNFCGVNGICAGAIMGLVGTLWCDETLAANIIPVDMTVNALLACAWNAGVKKTAAITHNLEKDIILTNCEENYKSDYVQCANNNNNNIGIVYQTSEMYMEEDKSCDSDPCIYNYVSNTEKPITWGELSGINMLYAQRCPPKNAVWCLNFEVTKNYSMYMFYMFVFSLIPALFFDAVAFVIGQKPRLYKIHKQTSKLAGVLSYFCTKEWQYTNNNVQKLWQILDTKDKEIFPFSMNNMNWLDYFRGYIPGTRKYLCKEDDSTIPDGIRKRDRFKIVSYCIKTLICYFLISIVFYILRSVVDIIFNY